MATYEIAANKLETCPYDETHRVKQSRFQIHVAKCEELHRSRNKQTCPFNAQHRCEHGEMSYHLMNCRDRAPVDRRLVVDAENNTFKGHTGVPSYTSPHVETGENWDAESTSRSPAPGYEPRVEPPNGGIRTDFSGMRPAERKQYYKNLHHRQPGDEELDETLERHQDVLPELRQPTSVSYAQLLDQQRLVQPVHELQNVGLGRGQPVSASSRIAANIFGDRQPRSAPNIPGFRASNLGIGRGVSLVSATRQGGSATAVHEIDVNHVGLGRGVNR